MTLFTTFRSSFSVFILFGLLTFGQSLHAKSRIAEAALPAPAFSGTPELVVSKLLKLYPNPNHGHEVFIKGFTKNTQATIQVKNAIGYLVAVEKVYTSDEEGTVRLDISALPEGHYYLHIKVEKAQIVKKLIKL
ncbi:T9SS type A sorting domain-containing protein [Rufibacter psychrotolerans]|uniref:T9SS type A sorting domain-containing protein n=1 Tax=Rufibacter psychrotolerans TaxID=2812556 RepID=UPI0019689594|nr:T9SS type A sorting domain-containing protein [Rufibacter sp. SYSU D00308]